MCCTAKIFYNLVQDACRLSKDSNLAETQVIPASVPVIVAVTAGSTIKSGSVLTVSMDSW